MFRFMLSFIKDYPWPN